jgi:putative aldouronate transport system substrate-binding protein
MKRHIYITGILMALLAIIFMSGCQDKTDSMDLLGKGIKTEDLEPVTLTFYFIDTWSNQEDNLREVLDEVEKRVKKTLNITLDFRFSFFFDHYNTIEKVIESGEPCDMYGYNTWSNEHILAELYHKGLTMDITTLFPEYAPGLYKKCEPGHMALHTVDGKLLAVPNHFPYINKMCVSVRDDYMKKYNIPTIKSLDDLEVYMDTVKKNEEKMALLSLNNTLVDIFATAYKYVILDFELGLVYKWDDPQMTIIPWEQTPEYPEAVARAYTWYKKGYFQKGYFYLEPDPGLLRSGVLAAIMDYQLSVFDFNTILYEENTDFRYLEYPLFPDIPAQAVAHVYEGLVVSPNAEHPERALMFIDWIYGSQDNYDLIRYGLKKKHYLLKGNQYAFPEGITSQNAFFNWQWTLFLDIDYERTSIAHSKKYRQEVLDTYKSNTRFPPHGSFRPDYRGLDITPRKMARYDMEGAIGAGEFTEDSIREYIDQEKEKGIDAIVAEIQSQLDEWQKEHHGGK